MRLLRKFRYRFFKVWIKQNRPKFKHHVYFKKQRDHYQIVFHGISKKLYFKMESLGIEIYVIHNGKSWDGFIDLEILEARTNSGHYYCSFCLPEYRKMYTSRERFWIEHCLEPFLDWTNSHLTEDMWLCLRGGLKAGYTEAKIVSAEKLENEKLETDFTTAVPIINCRISKK